MGSQSRWKRRIKKAKLIKLRQNANTHAMKQKYCEFDYAAIKNREIKKLVRFFVEKKNLKKSY